MDRYTLAIPDRLGNHRGDTFLNVLENPNVGIVFIVPKRREVVRLSGTAQAVKDTDLLASMMVNGKQPDLALLVRVKEAFFHCGKSMIRSCMWEPVVGAQSKACRVRAILTIRPAGVGRVTNSNGDIVEERYNGYLDRRTVYGHFPLANLSALSLAIFSRSASCLARYSARGSGLVSVAGKWNTASARAL